MERQELRDALRRVGLSQAAFSRLLNVNVVTVNRWAAGPQDVPPWVPVMLRAYEMLPPTKRARLFERD